jgi:hypothetical protein
LADDIAVVRRQLAEALRENKTAEFVWRESQFTGATRDPLLRELVAAGWTYSSNSDYNGRYYTIFPNQKSVNNITFDGGEHGSESPLPTVREVLQDVLPEVREQLGKLLRQAETAEFVVRDELFVGSTAAVLLAELIKGGWKYSSNSDYQGRYYTIFPNPATLTECARSSESGEGALPTVQSVLSSVLPKVRAELAEALDEAQTKPFVWNRSRFIGSTETVLVNELRSRGWVVSIDGDKGTIYPNNNAVKAPEQAEQDLLPTPNDIVSEVLPKVRVKLAEALKAAETKSFVWKRSLFTGCTETLLVNELKKQGWNVSIDGNNATIYPNQNFVKPPVEPEIDRLPTPEECKRERLGATRFKLAQKMREANRHEFKWPLRDFPDDTAVTLLAELVECEWDYDLVPATETDPVSYLIKPRPM